MSDFFEKPQSGDAPTKGGINAPWTIRAEYKSGKTPDAFAEVATPEQVKAGFCHYDKDAGVKRYLENFTASIVAITFGVAGTVEEDGYYVNYLSNLVFDTRDQPIEVFQFVGPQGDRKKHVIASGFYSDFKTGLPKGVRYCKVLVCYVHETQSLMSLQVSASLEQALKEGIAAATGEKLSKVSLFGIADHAQRFWTFRFKAGNFTKRTKDGGIWDKKGDMFFYPSISCGIVNVENVPVLAEHRQAVTDYIEASQKALWKSKEVDTKVEPDQAQAARIAALSTPSNTAPPTRGFADPVSVPLPTQDTTNFEVGALPGDDLPF